MMEMAIEPDFTMKTTYKRIPSKFRSPNNIRYTKQLFYDMQQTLPTDGRLIDPLYTLFDDREGLINFGRTYVELGDPTGYQIASRLLENYDHWNLLMKSAWFREAKEVWDQELDAKLSSEGLTTIRQMAEGFEGLPPASQLQAAKYLADKAYKKSGEGSSKRGRPSKEEIEGHLKNEASSASDIAKDLARIRVVKG